MSVLQIGISTVEQTDAEGNTKLAIPFNSQVAFQTSTFGPKASKDLVANFSELESWAKAGHITYGEVFYLPCVLFETRVAKGNTAPRAIMRADGTRVELPAPAPADEDEAAL